MIEQKQIFNSPDEILRAAVARAKRVPDGFDMSTWVKDAETPCGTAGGLAYEIVAVAGDLSQGIISQQATEILGLDREPALFYLEAWPKPFHARYDQATTPEERVDALEAVVEAWINGTLYDDVTHIEGNVRLNGYRHALPNSITSIGGYLDLSGYGHPLPKNLVVKKGIIR
jgi:hypothetical protein